MLSRLRTEIAARVKVDTMSKLQAAYRLVPQLNEAYSVNTLGYTRTSGRTDYLYIEDDISKVDQSVKRAIVSLREEI